MKATSSKASQDELRDEYALDYAKSKPNRFAAKLKDTTVVVLQPDVAEVFQSSKVVNDLLRSAITATRARRTRSKSSGSDCVSRLIGSGMARQAVLMVPAWMRYAYSRFKARLKKYRSS